MNTKLALATATLALMAAGPASALEVTAGGSLDVQTNWAALKNLVDAANTRISTVQTDLDKVSSTVDDLKGNVSSLQGRMTNAEGSIDGLNSNMSSVKYCGSYGYVFNGSGCRTAAAPAPSCHLNIAGVNGPCGGGMPGCTGGMSRLSVQWVACYSNMMQYNITCGSVSCN
ncbi:hypothetical protein SAMN05421890_4914 [Ensifer adhaerens]|nr:hypothetical protein SAMN05421890_4914 [Ensifer adhaerens]